MAAKKTKSTKLDMSSIGKRFAALTGPMPKFAGVTSRVKKNRIAKRAGAMSRKKKVAVILTVLVLGYLLIVGKGLFIAATVNGVPISRLAVIQKLEEQNGKPTLDNLINEALIYNEARKQNISVTDQELNDRIDSIKSQVTSQGQDLDTLLSSQGMSQDEFHKQVKIQILVEKLLGDKVAVTDGEITSFLTANKDYLPQGMSDDDQKSYAKEQLTQQKLSQEFSGWISNLKSSAQINYFVNYQ